MAWDDAAPTATELAPASTGWDAAPPKPEELSNSIPWSAAPGNAVKDIQRMIKGAAAQGKRVLDPTGLGEAVLEGSTDPIKKAAAEPWEQVKGFATNMGHTIAHPVESFKAHPVDTAMAVAPFIAPFLKGAPMAEEAAGLGEKTAMEEPPAAAPLDTKVGADEPVRAPTPAPDKINLPPEAGEILKAPAGAAAGEIPPSIKEFLQKQTEKVASGIPSDVKSFVSDKAEQLGEKPVKSGTIAQYATEHGRNMTLKSLGAAPGQVRKIGIPESEKLADYANEKGIVDLKTGDIGAREKVSNMKQAAGQMVGDMRDLAAKRGANHNVEQLIGDIHSKIGDRYESGIHSGEKSTYLKALQEVAKTPGTPNEMANTISRLFQKAKNDNMAQNMRSLKKPEGPYADVARELRSANENLLNKTLDAKELNAYHHALEDYGATTQIGEFQKMKQSRDMGGRLPPGMGVTRAALQKGLDVVGYRAEGQIVNRIAKWLRENPESTVKAKDIFRKYIDEAAEAAHEIGDGLQ